MLYQGIYISPIGKITIVCSELSLRGIYIENQKYFLAGVQEPIIQEENSIILQVRNWLDLYFSKQRPDLNDLPIELIGTEFQVMVWKILCQIPYGKVTTYKEIASKIAVLKNKKNMSSQAVGQAVGHNPISIIVPCHRVVGSNGSLTGYAGGIETKVKLLELEEVDMSQLLIPNRR